MYTYSYSPLKLIPDLCFRDNEENSSNLLYLLLCVKSELEEQRGHKVLTVMPTEFDLLLLVSLQ